MVRAAARVGGEAANARPVELRHDRWRELVGNEHARRVEILQTIARSTAILSQVETETPGDVVHVALALVQISVVEIVEDGGQLVERALYRPLGVDPFVADHRRSPADQRRIIEHEQLGVEQGCQVRPFQLGDAMPDLLELLARSLPRTIQRRQLPRDAIDSNRKTDHLRALNGNQGGADGHAWRHTNTF